jgi:hypothetical protein
LSIFISRKKSGKDYRQQIFEQLKTKNKHQNNIWSDRKKTKKTEINKKNLKPQIHFSPPKLFKVLVFA